MPGDSWCLCALRWEHALQNGVAPRVFLAGTHERALDFVGLDELVANQLDTPPTALGGGGGVGGDEDVVKCTARSCR